MEFKDRYIFSDSVAVAEYVVWWAAEHHYTMNVTKLMKMLYVMYGATLAIYGCRLFREHAQAWPYGPVFPRARKRMAGEDFATVERPDMGSEEPKLAYITEFAFKGFGDYTASQLVEWSHRGGSPWSEACSQAGFDWGDEIPDGSIADYFEGLIRRGDE